MILLYSQIIMFWLLINAYLHIPLHHQDKSLVYSHNILFHSNIGSSVLGTLKRKVTRIKSDMTQNYSKLQYILLLILFITT